MKAYIWIIFSLDLDSFLGFGKDINYSETRISYTEMYKFESGWFEKLYMKQSIWFA